MKIIVTGGAGFIGGNFVHYMLDRHPEDEIICVDCLTYAGNMETLASVMDNPKFQFEKLDITDREGIYGLFEREHPDIVVNFAAESHVDRSIENPEVFLKTNILGTQVLLDACRKYGIKAVLYRGDTDTYFQPIFGIQGECGSAGTGVWQDLYAADQYFKMFK